MLAETIYSAEPTLPIRTPVQAAPSPFHLRTVFMDLLVLYRIGTG